MNNTQLTLPELKNGTHGRIIKISGGQQAAKRLNALGIVPGKEIMKVSGMPLHGPVIVDVNRTRVALGFGLAKKVFVEVLDENSAGR
ncbi:FeoA family protein [Thermodesulfitimonas sp.]